MLDVVRQLGQHLLLQAAHEEGTDALAQLLGMFAAAVAAQEGRLRAQIAGQDEIKDYFKKRFDNNTNSDKKWDNNAVRYFGFNL